MQRLLAQIDAGISVGQRDRGSRALVCALGYSSGRLYRGGGGGRKGKGRASLRRENCHYKLWSEPLTTSINITLARNTLFFSYRNECAIIKLSVVGDRNEKGKKYKKNYYTVSSERRLAVIMELRRCKNVHDEKDYHAIALYYRRVI